MNRLLLIAAFIFSFSTQQSFSQCTPNTAITQPGIFPDSATGLAAGVVGQPYTQVLQLKVPVDTLVGPFPVPINSIELLSFTGLPAGLTYACSPSNCTYPGGSNGCVAITGTPTVAGNYTLTGILETTVTIFGFPVTQVDTVDYYTIDVTNSTGLSEDGLPTFTMSQNMPNPCEDITTISFTLPFRSQVDFYMHNVIGKEVFHKIVEGEQGDNTLRIDARDFSPGVYMYSMQVAGESLTKRMVISKK